MVEKTEEKKAYRDIPPRHMMATTALYGDLGPLHLKKPDLCIIYGEDDVNFIGRWVTGFGFDGLKFPKATTRALTEEEKKLWESMVLIIGDAVGGFIRIKEA